MYYEELGFEEKEGLEGGRALGALEEERGGEREGRRGGIREC